MGQFLKLSAREGVLLAVLYRCATDLKIKRKSDAEFDLQVKGKEKLAANSPIDFTAWLPLAAIGDLLDWHTPIVADMTDYPDMAREGDWSAVRDTNTDKHWAIFNEYVLPIIEIIIDKV